MAAPQLQLNTSNKALEKKKKILTKCSLRAANITGEKQ